jgi:hypothetical protein
MPTQDEILAQQSILFFLEQYKITNDQGQPLDFKDHAYLWDIYKDFTPQQVVLKAAQIGFSTTANIKALWLAKNRGMDIIYSLPSASDIKDFVSGKTNRLIDHNPIFQQWTSDKDSIEQKRVGANVIYFKGTWTERAAIATPADLYISDETDRSKQEIVQQFKTRLQHSKYAWEWYFSNPSAPGHGVDKYWAESDQKHWFVKCEHCNHEWYLTMDNIMGSPAYFGCVKCKKELNRRRGRWIAKHSQIKDNSGYWIPSFVNPNLSAPWVLKQKGEKSEEQFANFVLGQAYIGKGNILTRQMFLQNLTSRINPQDSRPIIGVDTGVGINYVVANKHGTFFYDKCEDYEPIRKLLKQWPNAICVIDQGGDIIGPRKLREEFPGRVFLCFFRASQKNDNLIKWDDEQGTVVADRDRLIQLVVDEFVEKRMPVYGSEAEWYDYMREWLGMYRSVEENALGIPIHHWNKPSTGRCDYPFAQVYARIGLERFLESSSQFIDPAKPSFAQEGYEAKPDGTVFAPKVF